MTSSHTQYAQPGPSSLPYHPHSPFGDGSASYQHPMQRHAPPPGVVNGGLYRHQDLHGPGPDLAFHPPYPLPQLYHGYYPDHHRQPYEHHRMNGAPIHMARGPHGPNVPPQSIHINPPGYSADPAQYAYSSHAVQSPGRSVSALPKQLLMPPQSPLQHPLKPMPHIKPEPPPPLAKSHQSPPVPSSPGPQSPPASEVFQPAQSPLSLSNRSHDILSSPTPHSPDLPTIPQHDRTALSQVLPERSNSTYSLRSRRPKVLVAVAVTVSSAARPHPVFYNLTAPESVDGPLSRPRRVSHDPHPVQSAEAKPIPVLDSPRQQSLASSGTASASTATHTPIPGSPISSITSASLLTSPVSKSLASPAVSVRDLSSDTSEAGRKPETPTPKKTWASLLRPPPNILPGSPLPTSSNGLPTSSVQGFSIPATPPTSTKTPSRSDALTALLTSPNVPSGPLPPLQARGLVNLGNLCFANTVLLVLVFCPPFYHFFAELDRTPRGEPRPATPLIDATVEFMKEFQEPTTSSDDKDKNRDAFVPTCVYDALKKKTRFDSMRGGQQEDAEEFLGFYLDTLEEELLSITTGVKPTKVLVPAERHSSRNTPDDGWLEVGKKNKSVITRTHVSQESPISRIFSGRLRTVLKIPGVREFASLDPWSRFPLDIQPDHVQTIEDALRHSATLSMVQVARLGAQGDSEASQQTLIDALPLVLVLHLKRFLYDTTAGDVVKLRKSVAFGTELEVPKEAITISRRGLPHKYRLFGVLNHHGYSATGGHYTLDVLHSNDREDWVRIDDELVQHVREEDLQTRDVGDDRTAYLLFYQRITPGART